MLYRGAISSFRRFPKTGADNLPKVLCILQPSYLLSSSEANSENTRSALRLKTILGTRTSCLPVRLDRQYLPLDASPFALLHARCASCSTRFSNYPLRHPVTGQSHPSPSLDGIWSSV